MQNQFLEEMPKLKTSKFNKRFLNLKSGFDTIFNKKQLHNKKQADKKEIIVTPLIP